MGAQVPSTFHANALHLGAACQRAEMLQRDGTWLISCFYLGNVSAEDCCSRGRLGYGRGRHCLCMKHTLGGQALA